MKLLKFLALAAGIALFAWILATTDLKTVGAYVMRLGGMGKWCHETDATFKEAPPSKLRAKPGCCGARVK